MQKKKKPKRGQIESDSDDDVVYASEYTPTDVSDDDDDQLWWWLVNLPRRQTLAPNTLTVIHQGRPSFRPSIAPDSFQPPPPSFPSAFPPSLSSGSIGSIGYSQRDAASQSTLPTSRLARTSIVSSLPFPSSSSASSSSSSIPEHISLMQKRSLLHWIWPYVNKETLQRVEETSCEISRLVEIWRMMMLITPTQPESLAELGSLDTPWIATRDGFSSFFSSLVPIGEGGFKKVLFANTPQGEEALCVIEMDALRRNRTWNSLWLNYYHFIIIIVIIIIFIYLLMDRFGYCHFTRTPILPSSLFINRTSHSPSLHPYLWSIPNKLPSSFVSWFPRGKLPLCADGVE